MLIDGWNFIDSLYRLSMTFANVGYGEVHPQGPLGRIFTSGLIVVGVATMLYSFGVFASTLTDNALGEYRRQRRLQHELDHLRDHFIICGYGRIGTQIVAEFESHKVPYVVIDQTEEAVERIRAENRLHIEGDASKEEILKLAGIERARGLISAVDSDERAVYIVLAARAFNPDLYIVARAGRPDSIRRLELAGATRTISPYVMAGHRMAELAIRPAMVDVLDTLHHGEAGIGVEEMVVTSGTKAEGKTLEAAGVLRSDAARVLAVRKRDGTVNVNTPATAPLEDGDLVMLLSTAADVAFEAVRRLVGGGPAVNPAGYAFGLLIAALVIEAGRAAVLRRVGKFASSEALLADATNRLADVLATLGVIAGLIGVRLCLSWADSVAAILVAGIIARAAAQIAWRSGDILIDRAPAA